ncbi:hypothetical protein L4X63_03930 [Geomonas sp. Red32]|uniref:hypothetical protein n=1 Tax=Geomonas sp. Red32 TaxID=2912856 RepID=UPI00202CEA3E|nr:hypothetical protein [Geomonas sp. Red32]MCM0080734.1 hypothetical protein [Geomonas sp. Red32]
MSKKLFPNKLIALCSLTISLFALAGCGGGGSGTAPASGVTTTVTGVASKGPIANGTVKIFAINADGSKGLLTTVPTGADGSYSATINYTGPIYLEASGSYLDEATGLTKTIDPATPLRAALASASGTVAVAVTPLTDLAVQKAATLTPVSITAANQLVSQLFKVDIIGVQPVAPTQAAFTAPATTQPQRDYALALAALSEMATTSGGVSQTVSTLASALGAGTTLPAATAQQVTGALSNYLASPNNTTPVTSIAQTNLVNLGGGSVSVTISTTGTLPAGSLIGGIQLTLALPAGVTVKADPSNGALLSGVLTPSGVLSSSSPLGFARYVAAQGSAPATVTLDFAQQNGFAAGQFATLICDYPAGTTPPAANQFAIQTYKVVDTTTADLNKNQNVIGISLQVQ